MNNGPDHHGRCRLTLTINLVQFSIRPIFPEDDEGRQAFLFRWPLEIVCDRCAPHHGGKSANPSWLYSWARPRTVVVSQRPPAPGTTDALTPLERAGTPVLRTWQRGAIHFRWAPDGIITQGFLDLNDCRSLPAWPTWAGASSRRVFAMLLSSPWVLHDTAGRIVISLAGFLLGVIACALLAIVEYGAWALVVPPRPRLATEDLFERACETASDPMDRPRPISALTADGVKLAGTWHPVARGDTGRTTLLLHGFAEASGAVQAQRVAALHQAGWNVAALDLRGYGRSSGTFASFGGREAGDVRVWLDTLAAGPGRASSAGTVGPVDGGGYRRPCGRGRLANPGSGPRIAHG